MRIAHFIEDYTQYGGTERVVSNLSQIFKQNDCEVPLVFSFIPFFKKPFYDYGLNIEFIILDKYDENLIININLACDRFNIDIIVFHGYHLLFFVKGFENIKFIKSHIILVTHFSSRNFFAANLKYPILSNIRYNIKKYFVFHFKLKFFYKRMLTNILNKGKIVCVSKKCTNELKNLYSENSELRNNIHNIYNPLIRFAKYDNSKEKIIIYAGRIREKKKNTMLLIKAWEKIFSKCLDWKVLIIGDGEIKEKMIKYIESNKIKNVEFLGVKKDIDSYLSISQIAVCTSNSDALPQVLVEASSLSNAILTTAFDGGYEEIVKNNFNGFIVAKNNAILFSEKLYYMIKNDEIRNRMIENSTKNIEDFSVDSVMSKWIELFNEILHNKK